MKRMSKMMEEMGFNKDASEGAKEAFIKHLLKASMGVNVQTPSEKREMEKNRDRIIPITAAKKGPEQLAFDLDATGTEDSGGE